MRTLKELIEALENTDEYEMHDDLFRDLVEALRKAQEEIKVLSQHALVARHSNADLVIQLRANLTAAERRILTLELMLDTQERIGE